MGLAAHGDGGGALLRVIGHLGKGRVRFRFRGRVRGRGRERGTVRVPNRNPDPNPGTRLISISPLSTR